METKLRRARGRPKSRWEEHEKVKNPKSEGEDPELEVMEGNHEDGKAEQDIRIGTNENMTQIRSSRDRTERLLFHQGCTTTHYIASSKDQSNLLCLCFTNYCI